MLKKIDHHMLYMSPRLNANNSVTFRQNTDRERGRGAGVYISSDVNSKLELQSYSIQAHPYNNLSLKPLQDNSKRVSFKGFNMNKLLEPVVEEIPSTLTKFVRTTLDNVSDQQSALYKEIVDKFITTAKTDANFKKYIGLPDEIADKLSEDNLIKIPKRSLFQRTCSVLVSPITMFKDFGLLAVDTKLGQKILPSVYENIQKTKKYDAIIANYKGIVGLSNFTRIQENNCRRAALVSPWDGSEDLLIPAEKIKTLLMGQKLRVVDPEKGHYSAKHLMLGNRLVSGTVYAGFLSNDAYNTTMRYSNDEKASQEQRASRAKQEVAKIGMNMYIHNLLLSIFESQINKSMFHALLASSITVGAAEVLGRMLVGRPIFPSTKENLDKMEQKMQNKKGVMAAVGRLIAGDKRTSKCAQTKQQTVQSNQLPVKDSAFGSFDTLTKSTAFASSRNATKTPSFKGLVKTPQFVFEQSRITQMLGFIKKLDEKQYNIFSEIITDSLKSNRLIDANADISGKSLETILTENNITKVKLGDNPIFATRFINGFFSPITFVQDTVTGLYKSVKKLTVGEEPITNDMLNKPEFKKYLNKQLDLPLWKASNLEENEKVVKIYKEYLANCKHKRFEANGVKNLILTLEKRFKELGIDMNSEEYKNLEAAKKEFNKIMMKADGANHTEYDGNSIAQLNINLARAISTIFLITDSYNLTMQYSNDNKKEAIKTAKNRAAQEASRIASSAYIMAFTHKLISKFYNGSLFGAFTTVLLTSTASDSLARAVVGVPILRKTQKELIELEEKQQETKNPVRKALAYLIGKKVN